MEDKYSQNDEEFKIIKNNVQEEENEEEKNENESDGEEEEGNINLYNKQEFELENKISFFFNKNIVEKVKFCPKREKQMKPENNKNYLDEKIWRCRTKIKVHEEKNIRENSLFEEVNIPLPILYFLAFYCFTENYQLKKLLLKLMIIKFYSGVKHVV